ncbi:DUF5994 family protein [Plantactinospora sonchi]|uniref:DUF5994 family protein n=1 Tax=Plantactinospora sonchi TaxID=1544735 RepID=A0ABU7RQE6_9ACTN
MTQTIPASRAPTHSPTPPSTPRLRMEPTGSRRTLLDGGWWPRSTDPVAELPGLVLAIDRLRGPVTRLVLAADGWDSRPRRLGVAGRVLRLGYFTSQPVSLLTALCDNGDRVDLLVVAPDTASNIADAAMVLAAIASNRIGPRHILRTVTTASTGEVDDSAPEAVWEDEGGRSGRRVVG